jgi:hypothetical protein
MNLRALVGGCPTTSGTKRLEPPLFDRPATSRLKAPMPVTQATPSNTTDRGPSPQKDKAREMRQAVIEDADNSDGRDRDLEHGEGGTLGLPSKPGDLSRDD